MLKSTTSNLGVASAMAPLRLATVLLCTSAVSSEPVLLDITASSLYDAGVQHGRAAADRIQAWLDTEEMKTVRAFIAADGRSIFQRLRHDNEVAFPDLAEELRGIAEGAGLNESVGLDGIWAANLIMELEANMHPAPATSGEHCSDVYAVSRRGYKNGFAHGHNEDWSTEAKSLFYFVKYTAAPGADFESCAGLAYPGTLVGWAPSWNNHGVYLTQNTLTPIEPRKSGLGTAFVQRNALCGRGAGRGLDSLVSDLSKGGWSDGASLNLVDLQARRMANVEVAKDEQSVFEITEAVGNYTHFNMYKRIAPGVTDRPQQSTLHRQARADELQAPATRDDIAHVLSDTADSEYPIFRGTTLATLLLDGASGQLDVWCCGVSSASGAPPIFSWNLKTFFNTTFEGKADAVV